MGVVNCKLHSSGASGAATAKGSLSIQRSFSANYQVEVDNPLNGPETILQYFAGNPNLPWFGSPYVYGTDAHVGAICKSIAPERIARSNLFMVKVSFEPEEEEQQDGTDSNGNQTDNPLLWHDEIEISYSQMSIPAELATFRGSNKGGVNGSTMVVRGLGSVGPVVNSAGVPFDPPPEMEVDIKVVRITKNVAEYNEEEADEYNGTVNSDQVIIDKGPYKYKAKWGPQTARIKNISGSFQIANKIPYWKQTIEVHITPLGWRKLIVDRGMDRRQLEGDHAPDGTTVSGTTVAAGMPHHTRICGKDGYPITSPVLLDGEGSPLKPDLSPVYLEYEFYVERAFSKIKW